MSLLSANLQAFMQVAKDGTVHGAAAALGLGQTGVTQRIRSLEKSLKTTLFIRSRKGMQLTADGEALYRYGLSALELEGRTLAELGSRGSAHEAFVAIACPTSVMSSRIVPRTAPLFKKWPGMHLSYVAEDHRNRVEMVKRGEAQIAIVPHEQAPREMDSKVIRPDRYVLVGHPSLKGRRMVDILASERIIDFYENDPTTRSYLKQFGLLSYVKRPRLYANDNASLIHLLREGVGIATLTQEVAKPHLESGALAALNGGQAMDDPLAAVWYPQPAMAAYFRDLLSAIR